LRAVQDSSKRPSIPRLDFSTNKAALFQKSFLLPTDLERAKKTKYTDITCMIYITEVVYCTADPHDSWWKGFRSIVQFSYQGFMKTWGTKKMMTASVTRSKHLHRVGE
jgi:hypothetical protein